MSHAQVYNCYKAWLPDIDFDINSVKFNEKKGAVGYPILYFSAPYADNTYPNAMVWISELGPDNDGLVRVCSWFDIFFEEVSK